MESWDIEIANLPLLRNFALNGHVGSGCLSFKKGITFDLSVDNMDPSIRPLREVVIVSDNKERLFPRPREA